MDSECCMRFFGVEVDRNFEILKFQKKFQIGKMRKHLLTFSKCRLKFSGSKTLRTCTILKERRKYVIKMVGVFISFLTKVVQSCVNE